MKYLVALVCGLLLTAVAVVVVAGLLLLAAAPTVGDTPPLTPADLAAVRSLLQQALLKNQENGNLKQLTVRSREIEQAMNYLLDARLNGNARITINQGVVTVGISVPVPANPFGSWFNTEVELVKTGDSQLHVLHLQLGKFPIPASLANRLMLRMHEELLEQEPQYARVMSAITGFSIGTDQLTVSYRWQRELLDQIAARGRTLMLDPEHQARLHAFALQLSQLTTDPALPEKISVTALLAPMFSFARQRGGSAVEENRAALQLLAMYALDVEPERLLGVIPGLGKLQHHDLRLSGRHDFALHLLISAGLEVSSDEAMANEIGTLKEQLDTKGGGTGFSFTDLAVDHAGARLGELAVSSEVNAKRVQLLLADGNLQESLFAPSLQELPEFLSEAEFARRYTAVDAPAYNAMVAGIENRIRQLPLYLGTQQ